MILSSALHLATPELILVLGALALLVVGAVGGEKTAGLVGWLSAAALIAAGFAAVGGPMGSAFNGAFVVDRTAVFAKVAIYGASLLSLILGQGWFKRASNSQFEFPVLILLATVGMSMMVSSGDLISLYIGIELHSLALYVLAAFQRDDPKASEAGLKYFVLGALSSGLLLYGASLIYGFAGSMRFGDIALAVRDQPNAGVVCGLVFLICGLAFKVSAAPFHMWTPDVYEGAPTPVVVFITTAPKMAAMVLFARAMSTAFHGAHAQWAQVIELISLISFAVGAFGGLVQKDIKRLVAYSSIANIGYALLGIAAGTTEGVQAMLIFMVLYMIDVTTILACLIGLSKDGIAISKISDLAGLKKTRPGMAVALTIVSLSLLGMPPFSGFWSKYYVFKAAISAGLWPVAVAGLLASVVAAFYYLRLIKTMWFDPAPSEMDGSPKEAQWIGWAGAAFSFPVVLFALAFLDPAAGAAAAALGLG